MLQDTDAIDMTISPSPGIAMLVIMDTYPWEDPDSEERFQLFQAKLDAYCRYFVSAQLEQDLPGADRSMGLISFVSTTPASARMKAIQRVYTPSTPSYEILVRFADEPVAPPAKSPWWKFWA